MSFSTLLKRIMFLLFLLPFGVSGQVFLQDYLEHRDGRSFDSIASRTVRLRKIDGKYGLQNVLGEWLIKPEYEWIDTEPGGSSVTVPRLNGEQILVKKNGLTGVANLQGTEVIPCHYSSVTLEGDRYVVFDQNGKTTSFDLNGKQLAPFVKPNYQEEDFNYPGSYDYSYGDYDVFGPDDQVLLKLKQTPYYVRIGAESEGFTLVYFYLTDDGADNGQSRGVYGFLNRNGKWTISPRFSAKYWQRPNGQRFDPCFHSGRALVREGENQFRYIDTLGNTVFTPDTTLGKPDARPFNEMGYCVVEYYPPKGGMPTVVYYNTDGSERLHLSATQSPTPGAAYSPLPYWGYLGVYDSKTQEYVIYNEALTTIVNRFSIADSLSTLVNKTLSVHFSSYAIAFTRHRGERRDTKITDWEGNVLSDWSPETRTYDVLTDVYVIHANGGVRLIKGATDETLFCCDSCVSSHGYDLQHLGSTYKTTYGVFEIFDQRVATKSDLQEVNYKGQVIYREKYVKPKFNEERFRSRFEPLEVLYERQQQNRDFSKLVVESRLSYTPFNLTQADFDALYIALGWEKRRKLHKDPEPVQTPAKKGKTPKTIEFLPPVVTDDEE